MIMVKPVKLRAKRRLSYQTHSVANKAVRKGKNIYMALILAHGYRVNRIEPSREIAYRMGCYLSQSEISA